MTENYQITHNFEKPKNKRVEIALKTLDPKVIENPKKTLLMLGNKTSDIIKNVLKDIVIINIIYSIELKNHYQ
jgi:hypothetical protein